MDNSYRYSFITLSSLHYHCIIFLNAFFPGNPVRNLPLIIKHCVGCSLYILKSRATFLSERVAAQPETLIADVNLCRRIHETPLICHCKHAIICQNWAGSGSIGPEPAQFWRVYRGAAAATNNSHKLQTIRI